MPRLPVEGGLGVVDRLRSGPRAEKRNLIQSDLTAFLAVCGETPREMGARRATRALVRSRLASVWWIVRRSWRCAEKRESGG